VNQHVVRLKLPSACSPISQSYILDGKLEYSNQQLITVQERRPEQGRGRVLSRVGLGEQPCFLARARGSSASRKAAIPHAKAVRNWPSASLVKCATKSTASHYFVVLLRLSLAMGLKQLGQAARLVQRAVHGVEQRQIAQLGTAVNVALRKKCFCSSQLFSIDVGTLILGSPRLHAQVASYEMMNGLSDIRISPDQGYPLSVLIS
jgi:hypothetical protein